MFVVMIVVGYYKTFERLYIFELGRTMNITIQSNQHV